MRPVLLLVDLQADYLAAPGLEPSAGAVTAAAATLLAACRARGVPVVHVWTTVSRDDDRRMPHWRTADRWWCEAGTPGHAPPPVLAPRPGEVVVHKTDFSGFSSDALDAALAALDADTVVIAGVHGHACVRATALDAYARRLSVWLAADAIASDDPLHAAITQTYLAARAMVFRSSAELVAALSPSRATPAAPVAPRLPATIAGATRDGGETLPAVPHVAPARSDVTLWSVPVADAALVTRAAAVARAAALGWRTTSPAVRVAALSRLRDWLLADAAALADLIVREVGKPIAQARDEVARAAALLAAVGARGVGALEEPCGPGSVRRFVPHGVVALLTPWNNPLAIPVGKLAPAVLFGNTVLWKPSPAATAIAIRVMEGLAACGWPAGVVTLVTGDARTADAVLADAQVDAVALTGSSAAGFAAQAICARRRIPLQAELGGNNAALVAADADLTAAARAIAEGAFGFAGQRCTANRRVVVERACAAEFRAALLDAVAALAWGRPDAAATQIGPMISLAARARVQALVERAVAAGACPLGRAAAHWPDARTLTEEGAYLPPVVLASADPSSEIVQEESFGPVLVVQEADDWAHGIALVNGVKQGLVAAAFTTSPARRAAFLDGARAGIVKLGTSTAGADVEAPFGGWGWSGVGPPEHGAANREFYTRTQAVYR